MKVKTIRDDAKGMFARVGRITVYFHGLLKQLEYNIKQKAAEENEQTDKRIIRVIRKGRIL